MDRKELALAVAFSKAPKELQEAVKASDSLYRKIEKLKAQSSDLAQELHALQVQVGVADKEVRAQLAKWNPDSVEVK